jgi:predicted nucleic acid-binding protein
MARSEAVWVDSDVLLDWLGMRQPWEKAASELIERAIMGEWDLWFSPLTLANIFYVYRRQAGSAKARVAIEEIVGFGNIATLGAAHVGLALASGRADFEDEIQMACAIGAPGISAIITRNLADYRRGVLPVLTAEEWIARHPPIAPQPP